MHIDVVAKVQKKIYDKYKAGDISKSEIIDNIWWYLHKQTEHTCVMHRVPNEKTHKKLALYLTIYTAYLFAFNEISKEEA